MNFKDYLLDVNGYEACKDAREWNGDRTLAQCWAECERGDWMMWLLSRAKLCDIRTLTKIKALQVEKIRHLLKDPRSIAALDGAHAFGRGEISEEDLANLASDASDAASDAAAYAASDAAYAAAAASAYAAAYAAAYAYASAAAYASADAYAASDAAAYAARLQFLKECADIVRSVIHEVKIENVR